jgi:signal transduction histidine kinase
MDSIAEAFGKCKVDTAKIDIILSEYAYLSDSKPIKAIEYGKAALKIAQAINDKKRECALLDLIGEGYDQLGNIADAMANYNESFKIADETHNLNGLAKALLNLGSCYTDIGNFKLAITYYGNAIDYFKKLNDSDLICRAEVYISDALYKFNKPDEAIGYLVKAQQISQQRNAFMADYIYANFAECHYRKGQYELAKENALKGIAAAERNNDLYLLSAGYTELGKEYLAQNDLANAELFIKKGLEIAKQTNIKENLIECYNLFSEVMKKQKRFEDALQYKTLYITTKDSVESALNDNIMEAYENEKKNKEIALMKSDELRKDAQLKQQHYVTTIIFAVLLLLICISGYVLYSRIKLTKANSEIRRAYIELNKSRKEIIQQNQELIKNNERILEQSLKIEELNNLKDRLFSIISHDLRSPLNNLKGILNLIAGGNLSQERFQTVVTKLVRGVSSTSDLVENLLSWSTAQLKGVAIDIIDFDIATVAQNQVNLFEKQASDKEIVLTNEVVQHTLVHADKNMIEIVLRNLVANAIKFSHSGGRVVVTSTENEDNVEISVRDTGVGIPTENIKRMFQVKERFTTVGTDNEVGTGLGLLLCKDFVEKNNGTIGIESKEKEGSRFWFTLPKGVGD